MDGPAGRTFRVRASHAVRALAWTLGLTACCAWPTSAQDAFGPPSGVTRLAPAATETDTKGQGVDERVLADIAAPSANTDTGQTRGDVPISSGIDLLDLTLKGGWFMLPIGGLSVLVVAIFLERLLGLRASRIFPPGLIRELDREAETHLLSSDSAILACSRYPSSLGVVIRHMLMRSGRPLPEVEHAASEAAQRELDRLSGPLRWLHLSAAVAPLLGLLGTVWGMIRAFYDTTQLAPGQNRAENLAEGIYVALVTTLAGLIVAIPAALAAHYFEGKLMRMFRRLEEFTFRLAPAISRAESRAAAPASAPASGSGINLAEPSIRRTRTNSLPTP